jgi:hypothetical protein
MGAGILIVLLNELALQLLSAAVARERNIYIVKEQISIQLRSSLFLIINSVLLIILFDTEIYGLNMGYYVTEPVA